MTLYIVIYGGCESEPMSFDEAKRKAQLRNDCGEYAYVERLITFAQ